MYRPTFNLFLNPDTKTDKYVLTLSASTNVA